MAYLILKRYQPSWNFELILDPVWIPAIMIASQNLPPVKVPNKLKKLRQEMPLLTRFFGVSLTVPERFPFETLAVMRLLRVVRDQSPGQLEIATRKLWETAFETHVGLEGLELITKALTPHPFSPETLEEYLEISSSPENKLGLKAEAHALVGQGAFGLPWIEARQPNGERLSLFGSDRLEFLAHWLGVEWQGPNPTSQPMNSKL